MFNNRIRIKRKGRHVSVQIMKINHSFRNRRHYSTNGFIISSLDVPRFGIGNEWNHLFYVIGWNRAEDYKIANKTFRWEDDAKKFVEDFKFALYEAWAKIQKST